MEEGSSYTISIFDSKDDPTEIAEMLRHIASQIEQGMTSSHYPGWELVKEEND